MTRTEFINKFRSYANQSVRGTNIKPALSLAVSAVESRNGGSLLATKYKNYHGIKADSNYKGKYVILKTTEEKNGTVYTITDKFRVYNNALESYKDFAKFLTVNPRYKKAIALPTAHLQAEGIQAAGYATSSKYARTLQTVIAEINTTGNPEIKLGLGFSVVAAASLLLLAINRQPVKQKEI